jgi:ATP-binding cassette subfamily C protein CydC
VRALIRLLRLYKPHRWWLAGGIVLALATVLAQFGLLALSGWFLASAGVVGLSSYAAQNAFNFFTPAAGVRFFAIARVLCRYLGRLVDHEATFRELAGLRTFLFARLAPLAPVGLTQDRGGDVLCRLVADVDRLGDWHVRVFSPFATAILGAIAMVLVFAAFSPRAAAGLLFGLALAGLVVPAASMMAGRVPGRDAVTRETAIRADVVDAVQGMAELLTYGAAEAMSRRIDEANERLLADQGRLANVAGFGSAAVSLITNLTMAAILLIGGGLVLDGRLPGPDLPLLTLGALTAFEVVAPLPPAFQVIGAMRESARRIFELADRSPPIIDPPTSPRRPGRLDIVLDGIGLRYRNLDPWALHGFNLRIQEGEHVVVLGPSGAGKTSLINLLLRFADYELGSATLGGVELRTIRSDDIRSLFTVVSQRAQLFAGSIRDNLLIARPDADETELWEALEIARLADFVRGQAEGLETIVGEAGARLSGGEARRVALARAALRATPFLILDEPTEGLDPLTEASLQADLARITAGRTVLTVSHRLIGIDDGDRIIVVERGRVIEDGSYGELKRIGRVVPRLAALQDILAPL